MVYRSSSRRAAVALLALLPAVASCSGNPGTYDLGVPPHDVNIVLAARELGPNAFSPPDAVISLSTQNTVIWYNADFTVYGGADGTSHHLKSDDGTSFDSDEIAPHGVFQATFTAPGTYTYHCEYHPEMTGTVIVNP